MVKIENSYLNFLDIETTGLRLSRDRIIEIFISKELNGKTVKTFHSLLNPGFIPDRFILKLTNLSINEITNAPKFYDISNQILEFLEEGTLVAHNARFDFSFLKNEFSKIGVAFNVNYCCTIKMLRKLYPGLKKHNLDVVRTIVNDNFENSHRAEADTNVIKKFYYFALEKFGPEKVEESINYSVKKSAIPERLLRYDFNSIPHTPGVYIFYGKEDYPLYVGMSNNLRRRVRDHLYSDISYSKDSLINQQLSRIETIPTAGVLGAALRESYLVKKMEPLYNAKLRRNRSLTKIKEVYSEKGYLSVKIDNSLEIQKDELGSILGIGRSQRSVKEMLETYVKRFGLCPKLLGLEKGKGACFSYQLGQCRGACIEKIEPGEYNKIFGEVFMEYRIKSWPFDSAIIFTEESEGNSEEFLFNNWMFMGSNLGDKNAKIIDKFNFNFDTYKILLGYLKNHKKLVVKPLNEESKFSNYFQF